MVQNRVTIWVYRSPPPGLSGRSDVWQPESRNLNHPAPARLDPMALSFLFFPEEPEGGRDLDFDPVGVVLTAQAGGRGRMRGDVLANHWLAPLVKREDVCIQYVQAHEPSGASST